MFGQAASPARTIMMPKDELFCVLDTYLRTVGGVLELV